GRARVRRGGECSRRCHLRPRGCVEHWRRRAAFAMTNESGAATVACTRIADCSTWTQDAWNNHNGITAERPNGYDVPNFHRVTVHGSTLPLEWLSLTVDPRANNTTSASTFGPFSWKRMIQS